MVLPVTRYSPTAYYPIPGDLFERKFTEIHTANSYRPNYYDEELAKRDRSIGRMIHNFSIPSKRVSGKMLEIFLKYDEFNESLIIGRDSTIQKITKEGIIIPYFFHTDINDDVIMQPIYDSIASKNITDESIKQQMMETYRAKLIKKDREVFETNYDKIKQAIQSAFIIEIDHRQIPPSKIECDYYLHPNLNEKGMLCFIPLDSMRMGRHHLTVEKTRLQDTGSDETLTTRSTIPFIYEGE